MELHRVERALRQGPPSEPIYRPVPIVRSLGQERGSSHARRLMRPAPWISLASVVGGAAAVIVVAALAASFLFQQAPGRVGGGPSLSPVSILCAPEELDMRLVDVRAIAEEDSPAYRSIEVRIWGIGRTTCGIPGEIR
jgi:hypothetical protein